MSDSQSTNFTARRERAASDWAVATGLGAAVRQDGPILDMGEASRLQGFRRFGCR